MTNAGALAALYPSASATVPAEADSRAVAAAPASAPPKEPPAAQAAQAAPEAAGVASAPADVSNDGRQAEQQAHLPTADALYDRQIDTRTFVRWDEQPASAREIRLQAPIGDNATPEVLAERARFVEGLAAAGAGPTIAAELWADALAANSRPITTTADQCVAELRRTYGAAAETKLAAARALLAKVATVYPGVIQHLDRTGLGNSPEFIRKIAARASALERQR